MKFLHQFLFYAQPKNDANKQESRRFRNTIRGFRRARQSICSAKKMARFDFSALAGSSFRCIVRRKERIYIERFNTF
jgi:hypothetical protein